MGQNNSPYFHVKNIQHRSQSLSIIETNSVGKVWSILSGVVNGVITTSYSTAYGTRFQEDVTRQV
jgi:hypothetical protein